MILTFGSKDTESKYGMEIGKKDPIGNSTIRKDENYSDD